MTARITASIAFQGNKPPGAYEELADLVDAYRFGVVSVYNDLLFQPSLGPLLLMARRLRHARIGASALNPYTVHPLEIASQVAMLDLVSDGRAYVGLVRGSWLATLGLSTSRPLQTLREAVLLIRHLLSGREDAFEGEVFHLSAGARFHFVPRRPDVPILLGTWGARTARLAGELADEVKIGGSASAGAARALRPAIEDGSAAAGRPPGSVGLCVGAVTVVDRDRAAARTLARREVALYLPVVAPLDPAGVDPAWLERARMLAAGGDYETLAREIPDDLLDRFAFSGTPADVAAQVHELVDAGVSRVEFGTPHGLRPEEGIRLLGEQVLPALPLEG